MDMLELYEMDMLRRARVQAGFGYRTADLVLHLDGIQNTRAGTHNPTATVWEDLSGNERDINLFNMVWGNNYASFSGNINSYGEGAKYTFDGTGVTIEAVFTYKNINAYGAVAGWARYGPASNTRSWFFIDTANGKISAALAANDSIVVNNTAVSSDVIQYAGITMNLLVHNGNSYSHSYGSMPNGETSHVFLLATAKDGRSENNYLPYTLAGKIYAVRCYNRILSESELLAHWLIDKNRFNIPD
jgi:hypothetical protein